MEGVGRYAESYRVTRYNPNEGYTDVGTVRAGPFGPTEEAYGPHNRSATISSNPGTIYGRGYGDYEEPVPTHRNPPVRRTTFASELSQRRAEEHIARREMEELQQDLHSMHSMARVNEGLPPYSARREASGVYTRKFQPHLEGAFYKSPYTDEPLEAKAAWEPDPNTPFHYSDLESDHKRQRASNPYYQTAPMNDSSNAGHQDNVFHPSGTNHQPHLAHPQQQHQQHHSHSHQPPPPIQATPAHSSLNPTSHTGHSSPPYNDHRGDVPTVVSDPSSPVGLGPKSGSSAAVVGVGAGAGAGAAAGAGAGAGAAAASGGSSSTNAALKQQAPTQMPTHLTPVNHRPERAKMDSMMGQERKARQWRDAMKTRAREIFDEADTDHSQTIDAKELHSLMNRLNIEITSQETNRQLETHGLKTPLDYKNFEKFLMLLWHRRDDIARIYNTNKISQSPSMPIAEFITFLKNVQREPNADVSTAKGIVGIASSGQLDTVNLDDFINYITNPTINLWYDPKKMQPFANMSQPISSYYIASSNNTYLTEDGKEPSLKRYEQVLMTGARCVEVDTHDEGSKIVVRGAGGWFGGGASLDFQDVCTEINKWAFKKSPYPVIIVLDIANKPAGQERMSQILTSVFGNQLNVQKCHPNDPGFSPEGLRHKILLAAKDELHHALARLIHFSFDDFTDFRTEYGERDAWQLYNKTEKEAMHLSASDRLGLRRLTTKRLMRVRPNNDTAKAVTSADAVDVWASGAQMVAINYQRPDMANRLNSALFRLNARMGYLPKPPIAMGQAPKPGVTLHIKVISGFNIPKPGRSHKGEVIDPFVKVRLFAPHGDSKDFTTNTINNNGWNPNWNNEFHINVKFPDLSFLSFEVYDSDLVGYNEFVGVADCLVDAIRPGIRCVMLHEPVHLVFMPFTHLLVDFQVAQEVY